jgi:hypothetical protein
MSSVLLGAAPASAQQPARSAAGAGAVPPGFQPRSDSGHPVAGSAPRSNAVTVIAGVGVLLLAMGVGVLIGRSGASAKPSTAAPPQVIVGTTAAGGPAAGAQATPFTDDWPAATNGYTVQLQTLPQASTQASAVAAAKAAATAKGAKAVGALKSEDFSSLTTGDYVIYSGVFHKKAEAQHALAGLKKSFPGAKVLTISTGGASPSATGAGKGGGAGSTSSGAGAGESHPAPPKVAEELKKVHGKSYEEKSKNLPDVIGT